MGLSVTLPELSEKELWRSFCCQHAELATCCPREAGSSWEKGVFLPGSCRRSLDELNALWDGKVR